MRLKGILQDGVFGRHTGALASAAPADGAIGKEHLAELFGIVDGGRRAACDGCSDEAASSREGAAGAAAVAHRRRWGCRKANREGGSRPSGPDLTPAPASAGKPLPAAQLLTIVFPPRLGSSEPRSRSSALTDASWACRAVAPAFERPPSPTNARHARLLSFLTGGKTMNTQRHVLSNLGRQALLVGTAGLAVISFAGSCSDLPVAVAESAVRGNPNAPVSSYPVIEGGTWVRGANLKDAQGRPQARQEHAAAVLNGFVYLIGGFVPIQPPPQPTENNPEPFPFVGTGEVLVYTPQGHPADPPAVPGEWVSLPPGSSFPKPDMHHIIAVSHQGKIWAFGGHAGPFAPTDGVVVFTPDSETSPVGTWSEVRVSDGAPCGAGDECLALPAPRSAGAGVSFGNRIYLMGGVVPFEESPDPVNQSIRTTFSVIYLDTTVFPLRWVEAPSLHESREHFNAVVVDGRIWVFQGRSESSTHMRGVESMRPDHGGWRKEQEAPVGASANILAAVGNRVYSFGGEFIASNITGTLITSQVFDVTTRSWSRLATTVTTAPLDATGADSKHGTYGATIVENGIHKILAPGGAATAWFDPISKVHVFIPPSE